MEAQQLPPVEEIIAALKKPLEEPNYTPGRAPRLFDAKLKSTCAGIHRNVLLDTGFQAWFAYTQSEPRARAAVDQLPHSVAEVIARRLCSIKPHPTVEALFHHIFYKSFRGAERRTQLQKSNYTCPKPQDAAASGCASPGSTASVQLQNPGELQTMNNNSDAQRQRSASPGSAASLQLQTLSEPQTMNNNSDVPRQQRASPGSAASVQLQNPGELQPNGTQWSNAERQLPPITDAHPNNSSLPSPADIGTRLPPLVDSIHQGIGPAPSRGNAQDTTGLTEQPLVRPATETDTGNHLRAFPNAKNIPLLLPHQTCASVVVKDDMVAAVRVKFGDTPSQCYLEVDVYAVKVPFIARELFGVTFDMEDGRLWLRLNTGASVLTGVISIVGADRNGAEMLLGTLFELIKADFLYVQELDKGRSVSNLISLDIKGCDGDSSCLKIRTTADTASVISRQLWPAFPFLRFR